MNQRIRRLRAMFARLRNGPQTTMKRIRKVLTDDDRRPPYKGNKNPMAGHCYVASEALYHSGGKTCGFRPHYIKHEGSPHWFLKNTKTGKVLDPTKSQFKTPVPYAKGVGKGFLTRQPSKRARSVMVRARKVQP